MLRNLLLLTWVICIACIIMGPAAQPAAAQVGANEAVVLLNDQLAKLRAADSDTAARRAAVLSMLNDSGAARDQAVQSLLAEMKDTSQVAVQRAIVQGLRLAKGEVDHRFGPLIVQHLKLFDATWIEDATGALGRIPSANLTRQLIAIATNTKDEQSPSPARIIALGALGYDHSQTAAGALIDMLASRQNDSLKPTICKSLTRLTGLDEFGEDTDRWRLWWATSAKLNRQEWSEHLINNHARRADRQARQKAQMRDRLLLALRQRYRAAPESERQTVLIAMLGDDASEVRGLALELVRELLIGGEIGESLTDALLAKLDDPSSQVRSVAAYVLRDLKNEKAADIAAERLADGRESNPSVLRAYLLLMERLPRAQAIDAVLNLLNDPLVRGEAAGALIAAIDQETAVLDRRARERAATRIRNQLKQDADPEPRFVELLGRVGQTSDWRYIERWLDSENAAVREAAAKVWARYDQPLAKLAQRADDELIRAVLIPAAQLRGRSAATLTGLIKNRPEQTQLLDAWGQAIVRIASRVEPASALNNGTLSPLQLASADDLMAEQGVDRDLRLQFLSAGLEKLNRITASHNGNALTQIAQGQRTSSPTFGLDLAALLVRRAQVHLADSNAKASLADLDRIQQIPVELAGKPAGQVELLAVESLLKMGSIDDAFTRGAPHLQTAEQPISPLQKPMIDLFLSAADMGIAAKQYENAGIILNRLKSRLGDSVGLELETRISVLEGKIKMADERAG